MELTDFAEIARLLSLSRTTTFDLKAIKESANNWSLYQG